MNTDAAEKRALHPERDSFRLDESTSGLEDALRLIIELRHRGRLIEVEFGQRLQIIHQRDDLVHWQYRAVAVWGQRV